MRLGKADQSEPCRVVVRVLMAVVVVVAGVGRRLVGGFEGPTTGEAGESEASVRDGDGV